MNALLECLRTEGPALSRRVLDHMYRDPFWAERYGERGRDHADEDSDYHLRYLARALGARDPGLMVRYARWLRSVLVARGMCTRHLAENFRLLHAAIAATEWPDRTLACGYLEQARASLRHEGGAAAVIEPARDDLVAPVIREFRQRHVSAWTTFGHSGPEAMREDAANLLSYLADALAAGTPVGFLDHVRWFARWREGSGAKVTELPALLAAMDRCIGERIAAPEVHLYLREALDMLDESRSEAAS